MSEVRQKKRSRGVAKANITKSGNELKVWMQSPGNLEKVKEKCIELEGALQQFIQVHLDYVGLLTDDDDKDEADVYLSSVEGNARALMKEITTWTESIKDPEDPEDQEEYIQPGDSVSQCTSKTSTRSSTSSARVKAAVKKASLAAEAEGLKQRQALEQEEFKIHQKKEELALNTLMAIAEAEEEVYAKNEDEEQSTAKSLRPQTSTSTSDIPADEYNSKTPPDQACAPAETNTTVLNLIQQGQQQQQRLMDVIQLPRAELMTYDGDPLQYWVFIRSFDNSVENSMLDNNAKLIRLLQYCIGKAKSVIQCCSVMEPEEGYTRARTLLKERFGNSHVIAESWIDKVTEGRSIGQSDRQGLREFADELKMCRETLRAMGYVQEINTQKVLVTIVERLPNYLRNRWVRRVWEIRNKQDKSPDIGDLVDFVNKVAEEANDPVYGRLNKPKDGPSIHRNEGRFPKSQATRQGGKGNFAMSTNSIAKPNVRCVLCHGNHTLFGCVEFKSKKPEERFQYAKDMRLCYNCLSPGHMSHKCTLNRTCSVPGCGRKHTKFLHQPNTFSRATAPTESEATPAELATQQVQNGFMGTETDNSCNLTGAGAMRVALPIVPVKVYAANGNTCVSTYALLDSGSTSTFCSKELIKQLHTSGKKHVMSLTTIEKANSRTETMIVSLKVTGLDSKHMIDLPQVYTKSELPIHEEHLAKPEDISKWPHLQGIDLPQVDRKNVGLLIGQDTPEALVPIEVRKGKKGAPYATKTQLGWTLNGPLGRRQGVHTVTSQFVINDEVLDSQLQKFWKLDTSESLQDDTKGMSVNDKRALAIWEETICYKEGHYEMAIPFKNRPPDLPDNRSVVERRLQLLGKRLQRDTQLYSKYCKGMEDLVDDGFAEVVQEEEQHLPGVLWYLPHHPVYHPKKPDKVRIVFDCASKHRGTSLNDQVLQGPDLTNKLLGVLMRFRRETIALMADVQAMFHQVRVAPEDRDVLRYLWWPGGDMKRQPDVYRMNVHLFGGTWSPSCCSFALHHTAKDHDQAFHPDTISTVLRDFYVDDCLKSVDSEEKGIQLVKELCNLLSRGGFRLTKWISNSPQVLESIPVEERMKGFKSLDLNYEAMPTERALGMNWDVELDCFGYKITPKDKPMTRRGLLSTVSSIYDPHGYVSPCTLKAKMIMQDLSRRKLGWDEPLPEDLVNGWLRWQQELPKIEQFKVNRCVKPYGFGEVTRYELHHFSDASERAYGATSYLRMTNSEGHIHCCLLIAKSHLAPLKQMTIPRLELMGATVSVKLDSMVRRELDLAIDESVFWTDSTIVLQYIKNEEKRFHTFVANRVSVIHSGSSPSQWRHVDTKSNPADDVSRGLSAEELVASERWLQGPEYLWHESSEWPQGQTFTRKVSDEDPEVKIDKEVIEMYATNKQADVIGRLFEWHSSWYKLKKDVAWLLRVKEYLRSKARKQPVPDMQRGLTVEEVEIAEDAIVKYVQCQSYKELKCLEMNKSNDGRKSKDVIRKSSPLHKLDPVLTDKGIICVGGRLKNAPVDERVRRPAILPKDCHVASLIVRHFHLMSGHSGREHVLSLLRQRFWLVNARKTVRKVLRDCFVCKRLTAKPVEQKMADLPYDRVTPHKPPFSYVGVDCFGPFHVKQGRSLVKRYGCIFTCLVVRAVHIEILHALDTDSFINALQRFMCRRGQPDEIRSDNGSNFVGANRELRKVIESWNQRKIHDYLLQKGIRWKFNPPTASHMGGVWERQIRTTRKVMNALMKEQTMHDESLSTLMCLVESIINGRPITKVSDDVKDPEPLTPNHLLLLRESPVLPHDVFVKKDLYGRKRWRQVQYLADVFWRRWIGEYLPTLQERQKWFGPQRNIAVGDVVLVVDDDLPRSKWLMGRVVETHRGRDQLVRSARVKVKSTTLMRPVQKLCLLESVERAENTNVP